MKIGILTHHYVKNFGAYMQAYGLIQTLQEKYPDAKIELIDFRVKKHEFFNSIHFFGFKPGRGDTVSGWIEKMKLFFTYKKYECSLKTSKYVKSPTEIDSQGYDLIIVGSDEVWNFNDIAFEPVKFGVGVKTPMITYSASAGGSTAEDMVPDDVKEGMLKFKAIAVRDF